METITYIDRKSGQLCVEKVYGAKILNFLYGKSLLSKFFGRLSTHFLSKLPLCSWAYGWWQKQPWTKSKVRAFIAEYNIDTNDFLHTEFASFNDFFIRQLKTTARSIAGSSNQAIIPADARYRFIENIEHCHGFIVKGKKFSLSKLLGCPQLAAEYAQGSMVMARLCPVDYHRFHFSCDGIAGPSQQIKGGLYSVNPIALKQNIDIYTENKRALTVIDTPNFGKILYVEVGATNVGTIHQTFRPNQLVAKGQEKGYFSFGGSALLLFFLPQSIKFDDDLLNYSKQNVEILCQMGQSMGYSPTM